MSEADSTVRRPCASSLLAAKCSTQAAWPRVFPSGAPT